ncbi:TLC domain-containing protein At5g14285-like [Apium graveolens]|uniref:TLC domain-containing protein At5g14285-like n=1 Tax=Apium graveolens TaxID=4045 RepID=UPI003D794181
METLIPPLPDLLVFFSFYLTIYLLAHFLIFNNWSSNLRPEAASCLISYFHGSPAVFLAGKALLSDQNRGFASTNTTFQTLVLDYSIAYFLMDLIHYLLFYPSDILFIAHHLATLFVFMTCRFVVFHGAYAVLVLLIIAEVTSFCQNTWTLACARRKDSEFADKVFDVLSPPFYALYSVVRGFVGPWFLYQMGAFYYSGKAGDLIPTWVWGSWVSVVFMAILVSIVWIFNLWVALYKERTRKFETKVR